MLRKDIRGQDTRCGTLNTVHDMTPTATVAVHNMEITQVHADMVGHPHGTCPITLQQVERLAGLHITAGYFGELRRLLGGNNLHTMPRMYSTDAVDPVGSVDVRLEATTDGGHVIADGDARVAQQVRGLT